MHSFKKAFLGPLSQLSDSLSLKLGVRQMESRDEMHSLVQWGPHSARLTYYLPGPNPLSHFWIVSGSDEVLNSNCDYQQPHNDNCHVLLSKLRLGEGN